MARGHLVRNGKPKSLNDWIWVNKTKYYLKDLTLIKATGICKGCLLHDTDSCSNILNTSIFSELLGMKDGCSCRIVTLKPKDDAK